MLPWREIPSLRLLLSFGAGILLAIHFNYNSWTLLLISAILPAVYWGAGRAKKARRSWLSGTAMVFYLLAFGYHWTWNFNEMNHASHFSRLAGEGEMYLAGEISEAPVCKEKWMKIELQIEAAGQSEKRLAARSGKALLYVAKDAASENLAYGDRLIVHGKIAQTEPAKNPDAFDYGRYLHFQNIHHQSFIRAGSWELRGRGHGNVLYQKAIVLRDHFLLVLKKNLPSAREFSVGSALILGYRDAVPEEVLTAYSETGAMHLLAVSGMHVGYIFLFFNFFLKRIKRNDLPWRIFKMVLPLLAIWVFALVTGASPSVMRATAMFSFLIVGQAILRKGNIYNTLAISAFCLLLYNPHWLLNVGFQLSYLAVAGIVFLQPKITGWWKIKNWLGRSLWELNAITLSAQLATLPLTLLYFHQFPTYFWLSSLLLVPVSGLVLMVGLLLFFLEMWSAFLSFWVGKGLFWMVWFSNEAIFFIQKLPASVMDGIWMSGWATVALFLTLISGMAFLAWKRFRWAVPALVFLVIAASITGFSGLSKLQCRQIVVYNLYKHSIVDFLDGSPSHSLASQGIERKNLEFSAQNHRFAAGAKTVDINLLQDKQPRPSRRWFFKNGFVQFHQHRLAIVQNPARLPAGGKVKIDYVVLTQNPKLTIQNLLQVFDCQQIIFDASNRPKQVDRWKAECLALNMPYFDVGEQGAWVLDF